jgi:hypothetical protein
VSRTTLIVTVRPAETLSVIALSDQLEPCTPTRLALRSTPCVTYGDPYLQCRPAPQGATLVRESGPLRTTLSLRTGYRNLP